MDAKNLISSVMKYSSLYDFKSKGYHNKLESEKCWAAVSQELQQPAEYCKKYWQNLRSSYNRHLREKERRRRSESSAASSRHRDFYLAEHLSFLEPHLRHGQSSSTIPVESCKDDSSDAGDYQPGGSKEGESSAPQEEEPVVKNDTERGMAVSSNCRKRKSDDTDHFIIDYLRRKEGRACRTDDSPEISFFRSILPDMQKLSEASQRKFKLEIMSTLDSLLTQESAELQQAGPELMGSLSFKL